MKISRNWLQTYFDAPLPDVSVISDALTFHVFEIDGVEKVGTDDVLDVKVTANRGHDCLSHRGIARELSAILQLPMKQDVLRETISLDPKSDMISVTIENPALCNRYVAGYIRGVKVGPSPEWLRLQLEAIGQRSINNIVDATNYVMFGLGQPLHAFDAAKLNAGTSPYSIIVRNARDGEKLVGLDGKEYALSTSNLVIADAHAPIGIAGVKGGMASGIDDTTIDIIIESANFEGTSVRKTSQSLKLRTDASARFEQGLSPEYAGYGMHAVVELIQKLSGGEVIGFVDQYPTHAEMTDVRISTTRINAVLGSTLSDTDVAGAFERLGLPYTQENGTFTVHVPFERLDICIPEDLIEEVGRIIGYDKILPVNLPVLAKPLAVNPNFYAAEQVRETLLLQGYSEVFTSAFSDTGERVVANKVDGVRPFLRANLTDGLTEAVKKNIPNKDLLGLKEIKLFEIGTIWHKDSEEIVVATAGEKEPTSQNPLPLSEGHAQYDNTLLSETLRYKAFSKYPYIVRDISFWLPTEQPAPAYKEFVDSTFAQAGNDSIQVSFRKVDQFEKNGKMSLAFRLIFQSFEKTLTDVEVNAIMEKVSVTLRERGFEIR